jgi:predicted RNA binding protein YcfA (HicA-like mRNA interferase family)
LGKLKVLSGKAVCEIPARHGFTEVRGKGSRIMMQKRLDRATFSVPTPDHSQRKVGTLQSIIRQSGVPRARGFAGIGADPRPLGALPLRADPPLLGRRLIGARCPSQIRGSGIPTLPPLLRKERQEEDSEMRTQIDFEGELKILEDNNDQADEPSHTRWAKHLPQDRETRYEGPERRREQRRKAGDRRELVRFQENADRRSGRDRRKGMWNIKYTL